MTPISIPRELVERAPTLYGITGDIKDINTLLIPRSALTQQAEPIHTPWLPYLSDRADGVMGHYAIARWNPRGFREVWNLRGHGWAAFSDDVLTLDEAHALLKTMEPAVPPSPSAEPAMPCGHHPSLMLHSAETGEPLYCELCDDKSGRKDAELRETELAEANRVLREELAAQPSGEVLTDVRTHITAAMDNDLGWADRMLQMDKARKLIDATLAKIGAK